MNLKYQTPDTWFAEATRDLQALLSDHLHCERKAAESALSLVRRYPHLFGQAEVLARLAHEETSHIVQVAAILGERGQRVKSDTPNHYARRLSAAIRGKEPQRLLDELLVGAFIEARSHERLKLLAHGFAATGETRLSAFYAALGTAEERHAEAFLDLARPLVPPAEFEARLDQLADLEAQTIRELPARPRIH